MRSRLAMLLGLCAVLLVTAAPVPTVLPSALNVSGTWTMVSVDGTVRLPPALTLRQDASGGITGTDAGDGRTWPVDGYISAATAYLTIGTPTYTAWVTLTFADTDAGLTFTGRISDSKQAAGSVRGMREIRDSGSGLTMWLLVLGLLTLGATGLAVVVARRRRTRASG